MKILLMILQSLLLEVLSYDAKCRKELEQKKYYIYNANVSININVCLYGLQRNLYCAPTFKINSKEFYKEFNECETRLNKYGIVRSFMNLCELQGNVNLLEDNPILSTSHIPHNIIWFNSEYYHNKEDSYLLFWSHDVIRNLERVQNAFFDTWTVTQNQIVTLKFISNENSSLILKTKINKWFFEAWTTNYKGIMTSTADINTLIKKQRSIQSFNSTIPQICEIAKEIESTTSLFTYTCPTSVGVYFCHVDISDSCENLELGESVNDATLSSQCAYNFFNASTSTCTNQNPNITVCRKIIKVDLKNDKLANMSSHCKYSDGLCNSTKALWRHNYNCSCQKVDKHYRKEHIKGTILIKYNNTELILEEKIRLCGENVWYTNESIVVSETKLQCQSKYDSLEMERLQFCVPYLNGILSEQKMEITNFQGVLYYLILATTICAMWYIFNVTVNFYSLWTLGTKRTSKGYGHLMNCVSQSLTIRYLLFQGRSSEKNDSNKPSPVSQVYNSVENELYEKPR